MMTTPPPAILRHWMAGLLDAFSPRTRGHVLTLVAGAILAPGRRTVASALRVMGLAEAPTFTSYHRVLNRNGWSSRELARRLVRLLVRRLVPDGPIIVGLDDTLERRRGAKIKAKGIYRDPVRSSRSHFVKASGLRWLSLMLLAPVPYAGRAWALPFLTVLAPSARHHQERGRRHEALLDRGRQTLLQLRRWLPGRRIVAVTDTSFAALELLGAVRRQVDVITRLRLDANLFAPAPPRRPGQTGRPRRKGERVPKLEQRLARADTPWRRVGVPDWYGGGEREVDIVSGVAVWYHAGLPVVPIRWVLVRDPGGKFKPQAFLCTDETVDPTQILRWFVLRWRLEVTFEEGRRHLGVETQRQWSDRAIARTTPCLLALFSIVTLLAARLDRRARSAVRTDAWYRKPRPTFADTLAAVRRQFWREQGLLLSARQAEVRKLRPTLRHGIAYALCQAA